MEKAENVYVQLCDFGWADLGTWHSLHEASPKDRHKNVIIKGHTLLYECENNIVAVPKGKLAVLQGLENYLVAYRDNSLLICKLHDEQKIKEWITKL
jgi:mannose-1-phosphate guanylyltransferase